MMFTGNSLYVSELISSNVDKIILSVSRIQHYFNMLPILDFLLTIHLIKLFPTYYLYNFLKNLFFFFCILPLTVATYQLSPSFLIFTSFYKLFTNCWMYGFLKVSVPLSCLVINSFLIFALVASPETFIADNCWRVQCP